MLRGASAPLATTSKKIPKDHNLRDAPSYEDCRWYSLFVLSAALLTLTFRLAAYDTFANRLATLLAAIWGAGSMMPIAAQGHQASAGREGAVRFLLGNGERGDDRCLCARPCEAARGMIFGGCGSSHEAPAQNDGFWEKRLETEAGSRSNKKRKRGEANTSSRFFRITFDQSSNQNREFCVRTSRLWAMTPGRKAGNDLLVG
ncbi:hypothetical protein FBQ99_21120 [Chloroflexi bacterium CFX2]|nr:hypothetical protein [Chloroflexi bacterium CFX2]